MDKLYQILTYKPIERRQTMEDVMMGRPTYTHEDAIMGKSKYLTLQEQIIQAQRK